MSAQMERHGVPIDMEVFPQLADKDAWRYLATRWCRRSMRITASMSKAMTVMVFQSEHFGNICAQGIPGHCRKATEHGRKTFENMSNGGPSWKIYVSCAMPATRCDGQAGGRRRRPESHGAVAVQVQDFAVAAESLAMDFLAGGVAPLADQARARQALAYVDWSSMEFLIAAGLSNDPVMLEFYAADPYLAFAKRSARLRATPPRRQTAIRERYKTGLLAIQYGIMPRPWPHGWASRPSKRTR